MLKDTKRTKRYESIMRSVCRVRELDEDLSQEELDSCLGVAMVLSYMDGTDAKSEVMADYLGIEQLKLEAPLNRLKGNGIFSAKYNVRYNSILKGFNKKKYSDVVSAKHFTELCWAHIAGIACAHIGLRTQAEKEKILAK